MKNLKILAIVVIAATTIFTSCSKDKDEEASPSTGDLKTGEISLSRATAYGNDWIYFSFEEGKEVDSTDHSTNLGWDIAFNRYNVRTNGGKSGSGEGGVYDAGAVDFTEFSEAPETGYTLDGDIQIVEDYIHGVGVVFMTTTGNALMSECIQMEVGLNGPDYIINDHVYVLKTAHGKYAKVWVKNYHNNSGESGYITFKYAYQADGSRKLN
jgi:hypothetical protein